MYTNTCIRTTRSICAIMQMLTKKILAQVLCQRNSHVLHGIQLRWTVTQQYSKPLVSFDHDQPHHNPGMSGSLQLHARQHYHHRSRQQLQRTRPTAPLLLLQHALRPCRRALHKSHSLPERHIHKRHGKSQQQLSPRRQPRRHPGAPSRRQFECSDRSDNLCDHPTRAQAQDRTRSWVKSRGRTQPMSTRKGASRTSACRARAACRARKEAVWLCQ